MGTPERFKYLRPVMQYHNRPGSDGPCVGQGAESQRVFPLVVLNHTHVGEQHDVLRVGGFGFHGLAVAFDGVGIFAVGYGFVAPLHIFHIVTFGDCSRGGYRGCRKSDAAEQAGIFHKRFTVLVVWKQIGG